MRQTLRSPTDLRRGVESLKPITRALSSAHAVITIVITASEPTDPKTIAKVDVVTTAIEAALRAGLDPAIAFERVVLPAAAPKGSTPGSLSAVIGIDRRFVPALFAP